MFEIIDHTADLGIRVQAETFAGMLVDAAMALTSVLVANPDEIRPTVKVDLVVDASDLEDMMIDWLAEWLYRFSADRMLFSRFEITRHNGHVAAQAWGEKVDPDRHRLDTEVKAITYHRLRVEQTDAGWVAEVILDL